MRSPSTHQLVPPGEMMNLQRKTAKASTAALAVLSTFGLCSGRAEAATNAAVAKGLQFATDQGRVASNKEQVLTVMLKLHNQEAFDNAVEELYNPESASYHKWFTDADFARYAPTAAEIKTVTEELEKQGLSVVSTDPQNFSVRVHGITAVVEKTFQTELHNFSYQKRSFQAHVRDRSEEHTS